MKAEEAGRFPIKIGGKTISSKLYNDLFEMVVDTSTHMPTMATLRFHDDDLEWVDDSLFDIGKPLEITVDDELLFKGEITAIEPHYPATGHPTLVIRAYDKSHRLFLQRNARSFVQQKDSDVASKIARDAGLGVDADTTSVIYPYLFQNNQTDMEFLQERASRIGYRVYVSAQGKLFFKKGSWSEGDGPTLEWTAGLLQFQPRLTSAHQAEKVTVWGWDPDTKKAIKSEVKTAAPKNQAGISKAGGAVAKSAFSGGGALVVEYPVWNVDEAKGIATSLAAEISNSFLQADGIAEGNAKIRAGKTIKLTGLGKRFSGKYFVTSAMHVYAEGTYRTYFEIHGDQPNTVSHLVGNGNGTHAYSHRLMNGIVPALVTNLNDPANIGRVKVQFPWLGDEIESHWARISSPMAGQDGKGLYWLPEVNDEVLVGFEHGDITRPYILGALWNKKDKPPKQNGEVVSNGKVNERIIRSRSGHLIVLDDTKDGEKIIIRDKTGKNEMVIDSKNNALSITIEDKITIQAKGAISVKSTNNDISLEAKNISLKAQQNCTIEATQSCTISANQSCTVEGKASTEIKGGAAKIALSGPSVNVNNGALEVI